jgi:hypothetical protein
MQLLSFGSAFTLNQNEGYGLPVKPAFLTASAAVEVSLDGVTWLPLAGADTGVIVGTRAIRSTLVGTIVMLKEAVFSVLPPTGGGGGGGTLPTAPLGQVLISQGAGVPAIFSNVIDMPGGALAAEFGISAKQGVVETIFQKLIGRLYASVASGAEFPGMIGQITDSPTNTPGAVVSAGGGAFSVVARWSGTQWVVVMPIGPFSAGGGSAPTDALGKVLISQGAGVPAIFSNNVKLTGPGTGVKLTPGTRDYNIVPNDAAGQIEYSLSDRISLLAFQITDTGVAVRAGQVGGAVLPSALLLKSTQAPLTITTAEAGGSQPVYIGRRDSDGSPAVGANVEIWPATGQAAPPLAVMAPGGASRIFSFDLTGGPSITITDPASSANNKTFKFRVATDLLKIVALTDAGVEKTPLTIDQSGSINTQHGTFAGIVDVSAYFRLREGALATKSGDMQGNLANISDSVSDTPGAIIVGSGTKHVLGRWDGTNWRVVSSNAAPLARSIQYVIDGNGSVLTTGLKGYLEVPYACTILSATLLADVSGSVVVDIWKDTYANYPPVVADTITASAKPTISAALKAQDSTLTGWNKTVAAGDILAFNIDSVTSIKRLSISLKVQPA